MLLVQIKKIKKIRIVLHMIVSVVCILTLDQLNTDEAHYVCVQIIHIIYVDVCVCV